MNTLRIAQAICTIILSSFVVVFCVWFMYELWPEFTIVVGVLIGLGFSIEGYIYIKKRGFNWRDFNRL